MFIVGATGPIRHGKSSFCDALDAQTGRSEHFESWQVVARVVEAWQHNTGSLPSPDDIPAVSEWVTQLAPVITAELHTICAPEQLAFTQEDLTADPSHYEKLLVHLELLQAQPELLTAAITEENKETFRPVLQWLGGYLPARLSPDIWYDDIVRQMKEAENEGIELCTVGGVRFPADAAVLRQADGIVVKIYRPDYETADMSDPTERERDTITPDTTVINDGDLRQLEQCAQAFYEDLAGNALKTEYRASSYPL